VKRIIPLFLAAALVGGVTGGAFVWALRPSSSTPAPAAAAPPRPAAASVSNVSSTLPAEGVYRRDAPGVVVITTTSTQTANTLLGPATQQVHALGSGFVINRKGDILTNDHVVQGASSIRVGFSGGATYPASVVGADPATDLAVVHVNAAVAALHPLELASPHSVQVGEPVFAIGNPFGLDRTLTAGIVSATGRDIQAPDGLGIANAIQTDAPINHGNSGGPLLDLSGRVVGVNAQIDSGGTVNGNVGVGFAIPAGTARTVASELIATGRAQHPWLGVEIAPIDPQVARVVRGLPLHGLLVANVTPGSPAAKAGLRAGAQQVTVDGTTVPLGGDVIVSVDGKKVRTTDDLTSAIAALKPGDRVTLGVVRSGAQRTVTVTLGNVPSSPAA
jgi:S1-C subfamily serine protease